MVLQSLKWYMHQGLENWHYCSMKHPALQDLPCHTSPYCQPRSWYNSMPWYMLHIIVTHDSHTLIWYFKACYAPAVPKSKTSSSRCMYCIQLKKSLVSTTNIIHTRMCVRIHKTFILLDRLLHVCLKSPLF